MLTEPLYQSLQDLGLRGMARQFASQQKIPNNDLSFEDRFSLLIDTEWSERMNYRYAQRVRWAKLGQSASMKDIDRRTPRGIDKGLLSKLNGAELYSRQTQRIDYRPHWRGQELSGVRTRAKGLQRRSQRQIFTAASAGRRAKPRPGATKEKSAVQTSLEVCTADYS